MTENNTEEKIRIFDMTLIISTVLCLLPIFFGLLKWNELPLQMPIHWGLDGTPDSYASKFVGVFIIPLLCAGMNLFYQILFNYQKKKTAYKGKKLERVMKWIIPLISFVINLVIYTVALGFNIKVTMVVGLLIGFVFVVMGNYLPKSSYGNSFRFGLNFKDSDKIAEKIKRPLGFVMVFLGLIMMICSFTQFAVYVILGGIVLYVIIFFALMLFFDRKVNRNNI